MLATLMDGGMGRELLRMGAPFGQPEWSARALLDGPEWVERAHANFIEAGAQMITTNSYAIVPFHIGEQQFVQRGEELAELSGRLARRAADAAQRDVRVAGSLPPLFGSYRPDLFVADLAPSIIDPLVRGLAPHVDVWLGETLSSIAEARVVREAIDRCGEADTPLWLSFTLDDTARLALRSGEHVADAVATAIALGAAAVLFNCCRAETITAAIRHARAVAPPGVEVGGYANRFVESHGTGAANEDISDLRDDLDPDSYSHIVESWLDAGATVVGGCCGIEPAHIAAIGNRLADVERRLG